MCRLIGYIGGGGVTWTSMRGVGGVYGLNIESKINLAGYLPLFINKFLTKSLTYISL